MQFMNANITLFVTVLQKDSLIETIDKISFSRYYNQNENLKEKTIKNYN